MLSLSPIELKRVAEDIYLAEALIPQAEVTHDPALIILFGWMGAQLSHLKKYTNTHIEQFPGTSVLVVRSHPRQWFERKASRLPSLQPILPLIPEGGHVLYHVISNGGALRFTDLLSLRPITPKSHSAILFDSCPGVLELGPSLLAFLAPFKNLFIRLIARVLLTPFFLLVAAPDRLLGRPDLLDRVRLPLNDSQFVATDVPRAYVYSKEDRLIQDWAVEEHGHHGATKGYKVTFHRFHGSLHAAHLRKDPETYKRAIGELWDAV